MRPSQVAPYPATGEIIDGKYQVLQMLGEGGMGAVAKAQHILRRAPVALKFMAPHVLTISGAVDRFLNEAVAASQIENQHVVTIFDVGKLPTGAPYLVMEYLEGRDLAYLIEHEGPRGVDIARSVHFVLQILRALQVAHSVGIIHRDMKPSNAFVITKDGERDFVKLVDFGISKVKQPGAASLTQTNSALGTPLYMSPEQAKSPRDVDLRSDLYSVGCILYELLTGRTPHFSESGELTEILFKLFTQEPTPIKDLRHDLPPGLHEAVHRGLARDPNDRYSNALDFAEGIAPFADERSAQVLQRLRAPMQARSDHPQHGSMPAAGMPSMQAAFSQLNSMQFPQPPTPQVSVTPYSAGQRGEPAAKTQALVGAAAHAQQPLNQTPISGPQNVAVANTQNSSGQGAVISTGMGVTSDTDASKKAPRTPRWLYPAPLVLVAIIGSGAYFLVRNNGPGLTKETPAPASAVLATPGPPSVPVEPVVTSPPPVAPSASASAAPSASAKPKAPQTPPGAPPTTPATNRSGIKNQPGIKD